MYQSIMQSTRKNIAVTSKTKMQAIGLQEQFKQAGHRRFSLQEIILGALRWAAEAVPFGDPGRDEEVGRTLIAVPAEAFEQALWRWVERRTLQPTDRPVLSIARLMTILFGAVRASGDVTKIVPYIEQVRAENPRKQRAAISSAPVPTFPARTSARIQAIATAWSVSFEDAVWYLINSHPAVLLGTKVTPEKIAMLAGASA